MALLIQCRLILSKVEHEPKSTQSHSVPAVALIQVLVKNCEGFRLTSPSWLAKAISWKVQAYAPFIFKWMR